MLVCSVQIISLLDGQSKFQMLFSGRHILEPERNTSIVAPYLRGTEWFFVSSIFLLRDND